tara:strand:- start:75 stop:203 length:129 start_codon:yes stop_codon:yes gene_type:complete
MVISTFKYSPVIPFKEAKLSELVSAQPTSLPLPGRGNKGVGK